MATAKKERVATIVLGPGLRDARLVVGVDSLFERLFKAAFTALISKPGIAISRDRDPE